MGKRYFFWMGDKRGDYRGTESMTWRRLTVGCGAGRELRVMEQWKQTALYCTFQLPLTPPHRGVDSAKWWGGQACDAPLFHKGLVCSISVFQRASLSSSVNGMINCIFMSYCRGESGFVRSIQRENETVVLRGLWFHVSSQHVFN